MGSNLHLFLKSSVFSFSSKVLVILLNLVQTLLVANALGPEKYGLIIYLMNFAGIVVFLFGIETLQQILVVFIPQTKSRPLFKRIMEYGLLISVALFALSFVFAGQIALFIGKGDTSLIRLVSVLFLLMPVSLIFYALFMGFKSFGKTLKLSFFETFSYLFFAALFVLLLDQGIAGLVYAKIFSLLFVIFAALHYYRKLPLERDGVSLGAMKGFAKGYLAVSFFKKLTEWFQAFFMGVFLGPVFLGFYYLLQKISTYSVDSPLISLGEVLLPFISEKTNNKTEFERIVSLNLKFFLMLSLLLAIAFLVFGGIVVIALFPAYAESVYFIPFFALLSFLFFNQPLAAALKAINRTSELAKAYVFLLLGFLVPAYFLVPRYSLAGFLLAEVISKIAYSSYTFFAIYRLGYKIDIIPKKADIVFFYSSIKSFMWHRSKGV